MTILRSLVLVFSLLIFSGLLYSQRLVPIINDGSNYPFDRIAPVRDMEVINGKLIIAGNFDVINGAALGDIFSFDGNMMEPIDVNFDGNVYSVRAYDGTMVIANRMSSTQNDVMRWSGTNWENIGSTFDSNIFDLEVHQDTLFAAGRFDSVLKKWDGSQWLDLGADTYSNAKGLQSMGARLYTFFNDSIPAYYENGELHLLNSSYQLQRSYGMNVKNGELYYTGRFILNGQEEGMLKVDGTTLVLDPDNGFSGERLEALYANNHWYSYDRYYFYLDDQQFLETDNTLLGIGKQGVKMVEYNDDVYVYANPKQFVPFYEPDNLDHVFKFSEGTTLTNIQPQGHQMKVNLEPSDNMLNTRFKNVGLNYPADSLTRPFFGNTLIASATLGEDTLGAGPEYDDLETQGWTFGPVADGINQSYFDRFMRVWKVTRADINFHIANYNSAGYVAPDGIASWPGNGSTDNGESFQLAPFVDVNNNLYYEPQLGDYPDVLGDEALYTILNDHFNIHSPNYSLNATSTLQHMDLEGHVMYYAFANQQDPIDKTLFVRASIFNRSDDDYTDLRLGMLSDFDTGNPYGDYVGCDSLLNYTFGYNSVNMDNDTVISFIDKFGYGLNPPATACIYLNQEIVSNILSTASNSSLYPRLPNRILYLHNEMHGKNSLGQDVGFNGINTTPMMFSDSPCIVGGENEVTTDLNFLDRVQITATDDITLLAGDYVCLDIAITVTDQSMNNISNACSLSQIVPVIQQYYDENNLNACSFITNVGSIAKSNFGFEIYPVPAASEITIRFQNLSTGNDEITIHDALGNVVLMITVGNGLSFKTIALTHLSDGVYFLKYKNQATRFVVCK